MKFRFAPLLLLVLATGSCGDGEAPSSEQVTLTLDGQMARERAAVFFAEDELEKAQEALEPLLNVAAPYGEDYLRMAILNLAMDEVEAASASLAAALPKIGGSPSLHYNLGRIAVRNGDFEAALEHFKDARKYAPSDVPSMFQIASAEATLGNPKALEKFEEILALGVDHSGSWHLAALYRLGRFHLENGDAEASREAMSEFSRLQATGLAALSASDLDQGNFGTLEMPQPADFVASYRHPQGFQAAVTLPEFQGYLGVMAMDLVDDWVIRDENHPQPSLRTTDLVAWGPKGILAATILEDGSSKIQELWSQPVDLLRGLDYDQDGDLDFWAFHGSEATFLLQEEGSFSAHNGEHPSLPGPVADAVVLDQDHEGDLDLLLVGDFGVRLWRDDGAAQGGAFTDITETSGCNVPGSFSWCLIEDYDTDFDVDMLVGGEGGITLLSNLRSSRFEALTPAFSVAGRGSEAPQVADWSRDGRPDLAFSDGTRWKGLPGGTFQEASDLEVFHDEVDDLNRDQAADRYALVEAGLQVEFGMPSDQGSMTLALRGTADNRRAFGAIVEYRASGAYQRVYWRGEPMVLSYFGREKVDWLKITWTNGVTQFGVDVPDGELIILTQKEGLAGSCPFLYTWNGETYEFISDVLGTTPLGLPIAEGMTVPPNHEEYVLVSGEQLVPRDGYLDLQFTEELREVTYLDKVRLEVVDHPVGSEVFPNERFTFPPFPEHHIHTVTDSLAPSRAVGSDGEDWTASLESIDLDFAVPFEPYQSTVPTDQPWGGQFLGLAPYHSLELDFTGEDILHAPKLRLLMTGWFYWSCAGVNMASSRTPGIDFIPPMLEVPDGDGGWRMIEPPLGFPAGKLKTMVVDVSDVLVREDPRIRVSSTLRLYWDSIRLSTDGDVVPLKVKTLKPVVANLWERGFSKPVETDESEELLLEWFQWDQLEPYPRWNQHPGLYTRLGDVLSLLDEAEDMFVVMGAGDAMHIRFDAKELPPLAEGWTRDYLVYFDGWAKDRDHSSLAVEYTEPFPFHGMSGFPYTAEESFPDTPEHRRWRLEWLTRPARFWLNEVHGK